MEFSLPNLAIRINTFDTYYEMSDDPNKLRNGTVEEESIAHWLHGLENYETHIVLKKLTKKGVFNYKRYFLNK